MSWWQNAVISVVVVFLAALTAFAATSRAWRRQERRVVYAAYVGAASGFLRSMFALRDALRDGEPDDSPWRSLRAKAADVEERQEEVRLLASKRMQNLTSSLTLGIVEFRDALIEGGVADAGDVDELRHRFQVYYEAVDEIVDVIRRDIGVDTAFGERWRQARAGWRRGRARRRSSTKTPKVRAP